MSKRLVHMIPNSEPSDRRCETCYHFKLALLHCFYDGGDPPYVAGDHEPTDGSECSHYYRDPKLPTKSSKNTI